MWSGRFSECLPAWMRWRSASAMLIQFPHRVLFYDEQSLFRLSSQRDGLRPTSLHPSRWSGTRSGCHQSPITRTFNSSVWRRSNYCRRQESSARREHQYPLARTPHGLFVWLSKLFIILILCFNSVHSFWNHKVDTPYMDGVPLVTQCPISPASTFRYKFNASNAGTHYYHSHTGKQQAAAYLW